MRNKFVVLKCKKCRATVMTFYDPNSDDWGMECCGEVMEMLIPNSVDAAFEKHVPTYELVDDVVKAKVNHVMEEEHYIEWIACVTQDSQDVRQLEPGMVAEAEFKYVPDSNLYAYCNKHGLWKSEIK